MSEAVIRQRLIRLSCAKLLAFKKSSEGLRRSLHVLTVLKHAHSDDARFEPECSDLLRPQPNRLIVILEPAPLQRLSCPPPPSPLISSSNSIDRIVPEEDENIEIDSISESSFDSESSLLMMMMETDDEGEEEEDGTSMARKRKNHANSFLEYGEKRHCDSTSENSSSSDSSSTTSKSLDVDNNNNN
jgi:hypothetical protein